MGGKKLEKNIDYCLFRMAAEETDKDKKGGWKTNGHKRHYNNTHAGQEESISSHWPRNQFMAVIFLFLFVLLLSSFAIFSH